MLVGDVICLVHGWVAASPMGSRVEPITCKTALSRTGIPGHRYCLNPYTGCGHACPYCYAPVVMRYSPVSACWGSRVQAKINLPEALARDMRGRRGPIGAVFVGSVTDAYQPCEAELGITRRCLEMLGSRPDAGVSILTKSALVVRDADVLAAWAARTSTAGTGNPPGPGVRVGFTLTVLDEKAASFVEPGASPPLARLRAASELRQQGVPVWVFVAPVLPGVGDAPEALEALLGAIRDAGVRRVCFDRLNPYPRVVANLRGVYARRFPQAIASLERYLHDPVAYLAGFDGMVASLARSAGLECS